MSILLFVVLPFLAFFTGMVVLQARHRSELHRPTWEAFAEFARRHGLGLRESRSSAYGLPEAFGRVNGRSVDIRVAQGRAIVPVRIIVSVGCRVPKYREPLYVARGSTSRWALGSPTWRDVLLGPSPREEQVRLTGPRARVIQDFASRLGPPEIEKLVALVHMEGFYAMSLREGRMHLHLGSFEVSNASLERALLDLAALADVLERCFPFGDLLPTAGDVEPPRSSSPRVWRGVDMGMMAALAVFVGILIALPLVTGIVAQGEEGLESSILLWSIAASLLVTVAARVWAGRVRPEEERLLREFLGQSG